MSIHLDFYNHCMRTGEMPFEGLCICARRGIIDAELFELFKPIGGAMQELEDHKKCTVMWASDVDECDTSKECFSGFGPLRQTIVLFMAAINDEL